MYVCCVCIMYVLYVCIVCMYCMYVLYVCIICMYYMCYMYVKLRGQVALRGQKVHGKRKLRIQGRMQFFEKYSQKASNHDLTLPLHCTRGELPESSGILEKGLICVELWSFRIIKMKLRL